MINKCPEWLKKAYIKAVKNTCEQCKQMFNSLSPHRIMRGHRGGTYTPHNVKMLCEDCHKKIHSGEFK